MKFFKPTIYLSLFLASLLITFNHAQAATNYWRGTTNNNWSVGTNWSLGHVPASDFTEPVAFDASSPNPSTLNVDGTSNCAGIDFTGAPGNVTFSGAGFLYVSGSITAKSGMSWTHSGIISIGANSTITSNAVSMASSFRGNGGSYITIQLADDLVTTGSFGAIAYTSFTTNNHNLSCGQFFNTQGSYTTTWNLGTSIINCSNVNFTAYAPTLTLIATSSTINITSDDATANNCDGKSWGIVNFKSNASAARAHLITPGSGASFVQFNIDQLTDRRDVSVSFDGDFSISQSSTWKSGGAGNDDPTYRMLIKSNTTGTQRTATVSAASQTLTFTDVDFQDIKVATTNSPTITKTRVGDAGGNAGGITSAPKTVYAICGAGNTYMYSDIWSVSNDGTPDGLALFPLPQDTALITDSTWATAGNNILTGIPRVGNLDFSALTKIEGFYTTGMASTYYGNLLLGSYVSPLTAASYVFDARVKYESSDVLSINASTSFGFYNFTINSYGGTVKLTSAITQGATFTLTRGTFDLNGNTLTAGSFSSSGTAARTLQATGGGNIYITGTTGTVWDMTDPTSLTVSNAPAVTLNGALTAAATFAGGGKTFGNFWNHTTGAYAVQFTGANIFNDFKVDAGRTVKFTAGTTTTVTTATLTGTSGSQITIGSITSASHTLAKAGGGTVTCDYCSISYSTATPASTWYATNSTNNGNNSGWTFATIYRSAAPDDNGDNNIAALATGGSNAMTISGSTATFTTALPDNIGVGDVLQYDSNNNGSIGAGDAPAFISGRTSSTVYTVKTAAGAIPTARAADTYWSIFRAYTSLYYAEAGTENTAIDSNLRNFDTWSGGKDLTVSGEQWNIALYANGTTADTTAVTIDGWTTNSSNFIRIYTPYLTSEVGTSQRHGGKWDANKYNLSPATGIPLTISEENVRVDGLEIYSVDNHGISFDGATGASNVSLSNNVIKGNATASKYAVYLNATGASSTAKIWNNLIYDYTGTSASGLYENDADWTDYLYNNTFVGNTGGINNNAGAIIAKNNIVKGSGNTVAYVGTFTASDYNSTDGTDVTEGGTHSRQSQTFSFVDATNKDFHLSKDDTGARGYGVNLSADSNLPFSTDIDGQERTGTWSIGADEPFGTTLQSPVLETQSLTSGLVGHWTFDGNDTPWTSATAGTTKDTSGNNNTGTLTNMSQSTSPVLGKLGQALKFDGVGSWVNLNKTQSALGCGATTCTISVWIKPTALYACAGHPGNYITGISNADGDIWIGNGNCAGYGSGDLMHVGMYTNTTLDMTFPFTYTWQHIVFVHGGGNIYAYQNGVKVGESDGVADQNGGNANYALYIGRNRNGTYFYNGSIDDVRIYNRALSVDEIGDLYRLGQDTINMSLTDKNKTGLVGMWSFDGPDISGTTAYDRSGNNNTGTISGATPILGKFGQALKFDGVNDVISVANSASLRPSAITISAWVKKTSSQYSSTDVLAKTAGSNVDYGANYLNAEKIAWTYNAADGFTGLRTPTFNAWNHIVFTGDSSGAVSYLNGTLDNSSATAFITPDNAEAFTIGYSLYGTYFPGLIDDVRIYNRALSPTEVQDLYNLGKVKITN